MPDYTTVEKVRIAVAHLASATNVSTAVIGQCITWAEGKMNAKLAQRYAVPVSLGTIAAGVLENIATAQAAYYTLRRSPAAEDTERGDWLDRFKEDANDLLDALATGSASLPTSGGQASALTIWSNTMTFKPIFAEPLPLEEQRADPDRLDAERSARDP